MSAASAADLAFDGRWLDAAGNVVTNASLPATMNVYEGETAAEPIASAPVTLATDAEGFFRTVATNLSLPSECRTFWIGLTPQDGNEIAPRMRVSPAPFALCAAEARTLEVPELSVQGTVSIGTLSNATATAGSVAVAENLDLHCGLGGANTLFLKNLDVSAGGFLSLFHSSWTAEETYWLKSLSGAISDPFGSFDRTQWFSFSYTPDADGIFSIRLELSARAEDYAKTKVTLGIYNGNLRVVQATDLQFEDENHARFFTLPGRRGERISLSIVMKKSGYGAATRSQALKANYQFHSAGVE